MSETITLERFDPHPCEDFRVGDGELLGIFVDCETTGFDPNADSIIQLAAVPFGFDKEGRIGAMGRALVQYEDPKRPIPAEVTKLTGITDNDVRGKRIDDGAFNGLASDAAIVIAHHAEFDRPFLEARLLMFKHLRWGCSYRDVPWRDEYDCSKLLCLMWQHAHLFYDAHHADVDCYAGVSLLGTTLPRHDGKRALSYVLDAARVSHARIYATNAPYSAKDLLKLRGYRWSSGEDGQPKAWHRDVIAGDDFAAEVEWLRQNAGVVNPAAVQFDSRKRFSSRIGQQQSRGSAAA